MPKLRVAVLVSIVVSSALFAQNNRSAVSLTGNDAATCTVPDPCRTFDVAISKSNAESTNPDHLNHRQRGGGSIRVRADTTP